jgi:hypothetical protein
MGKPEGKNPIENPRRRWEDNVEMDLRERESGVMEWINVAKNKEVEAV